MLLDSSQPRPRFTPALLVHREVCAYLRQLLPAAVVARKNMGRLTTRGSPVRDPTVGLEDALIAWPIYGGRTASGKSPPPFFVDTIVN